MDLLWAVEHGVGSQVLLVPITLVKRLVPAQLPFRWLTLPAMLMANDNAPNTTPEPWPSSLTRVKSQDSPTPVLSLTVGALNLVSPSDWSHT